MSQTERQPGGIKAQYDKVAFTAALVILLAAAGSLFLLSNTWKQDIRDPVWERVGQGARLVTNETLAAYDESLAQFRTPKLLDSGDRMVLVSPLRVSCTNTVCGKPIPFEAEICPFCRAPQPKETTDMDSDADGIPDLIETKLGLNRVDPTDAAADADGDGYDNYDEYVFDRTGVTVTNAAVKPLSCSKLRLARKSLFRPFKLLLRGVSTMANGDYFQLTLGPRGASHFSRIGDKVAGFTLVKYEPAAPEGPTLSLQSLQDGKTYRLVRGKEQDIAANGEWTATLVQARNGGC